MSLCAPWIAQNGGIFKVLNTSSGVLFGCIKMQDDSTCPERPSRP